MNIIYKLLLLVTTFILMNITYAASTVTNSPVGFWKAIDSNGKPKAIVQIFESPDKNLYGRLLKLFPESGYQPNERCIACIGQKHNQPILGMMIIENLVQNKDNTIEWNSGEILNLRNGKTYHCNIQLAEKGQKLNVRDYLGLPLFGHSQTWTRVVEPIIAS